MSLNICHICTKTLGSVISAGVPVIDGQKSKSVFSQTVSSTLHMSTCVRVLYQILCRTRGGTCLGLNQEKSDCLAQQAAYSQGFPGHCGPSPAFATPEFKDWMQSFVLDFDVKKPKHSILSFVWILSLYYPSWTSHSLSWQSWILLEAVNHVRERERGSARGCVPQSITLSSLLFLWLLLFIVFFFKWLSWVITGCI